MVSMKALFLVLTFVSSVYCAGNLKCYHEDNEKGGCEACWIKITANGNRKVQCLLNSWPPPNVNGVNAELNVCSTNQFGDIYYMCNDRPRCNTECIPVTTIEPISTVPATTPETKSDANGFLCFGTIAAVVAAIGI